MSACLNLVGLPYIAGQQDCYSVVRRYYASVWDLELPNFARPTRFWEDPSLDLYSLYTRTGFVSLIDNEPFQEGDAVLMPIRTAVNSHAGVIVGDNQMLHHLPNQLSGIDPLRPKWINRVTVHLRHPQVVAALSKKESTVHLHEVIHADVLRDPRVQKEVEKAMAPDR